MAWNNEESSWNDKAIEHGQKGVELEIQNNELSIRIYYGLADTHVRAGNVDAALDILEKILTMPSSWTTKRLQLDPAWKPLHDNPRFKEMMKKYEISSL